MTELIVTNKQKVKYLVLLVYKACRTFSGVPYQQLETLDMYAGKMLRCSI